MTELDENQEAFGHPGIEPRWTHGSKEGIGTAYSVASNIWFTLWNGVLTEIFYPTIDKPQTRDLQYLVSDGEKNFHGEKNHLKTKIEAIDSSLGYRIINSEPQGRYQITKEIISDPHLPCILQHTKLSGRKDISKLNLYVLCAPHLEIGGWGNNGYVRQFAGKRILIAQRENSWMALAATIPFKRLSVGYVGHSDGWQDLEDNYQMDWEFDRAEDGNIALMGELDLSKGYEFTLAIAFGNTMHRAVTNLFQSLDIPFEQQRDRFIRQWQRICGEFKSLDAVTSDGGNLYHNSYKLLLAHEDKQYSGAMIASLSIPWGQKKTDDADYGGYHLVWPRDLYNSATALIAAGYTETPLRTLIYLATLQREDGGFAQNFWLDGTPERQSTQLDEVAYPILLAWRLYREKALRNFDPYPMVVAATAYLIERGPVTPQERWEQSSGFSPATLAVTIAALICAATWMRERGEDKTAKFVEEYADFLECHIETWTVTTEGTLVPEISQHYIRITPASPDDIRPNENPNCGTLYIPHRHPDSQQEFPAKEIVDPSFLQLVRYGIRRPHHPLIVNSLKVVDKILKTNTPYGAVWKRYNHDGHGQRDDGTAWSNWGTGRSWTLLTGERGQYELAAGNDPTHYIKAMEGFASCTGLLPEQVWDAPDIPQQHMYCGRPTGSAMPLLWSHSEYIKLLRSAADGRVFDYIPEVGDRYDSRTDCQLLEIWKPNRQINRVKPNYTLRIQDKNAFQLEWSVDKWQTRHKQDSVATVLNINYVDLSIAPEQSLPIYFSFLNRNREDTYIIDIER
ncbi:glycoside hydrolase family 15 protein [Myxosarcina sp. GI1]|uniref:glycoside hydrolase family 15 protein n=1 Tax=Myxosarcina sp. GI1 TaxID=1541065 RepID=UPI0005632DF2|nr:glycoside hydrolase family 15 protein [Myxosarcina sp. GI1]